LENIEKDRGILKRYDDETSMMSHFDTNTIKEQNKLDIGIKISEFKKLKIEEAVKKKMLPFYQSLKVNTSIVS
jgi:hypothetical protein